MESFDDTEWLEDGLKKDKWLFLTDSGMVLWLYSLHPHIHNRLKYVQVNYGSRYMPQINQLLNQASRKI